MKKFHQILLGSSFILIGGGISVPSAYGFNFTREIPAPSSGFINSVAISGDNAIFNINPNGSGKDKVFVYDVTTGNQILELNESNTGIFDLGKNGVDISGNYALIDGGNSSFSGAFSQNLYVYDITTGNQVFQVAGTQGKIDGN